MITINKQIEGLTNVQVTPENFPRLFDGLHRVRDISIIETDEGFDIQTILKADDIKKAIAKFLQSLY